jgi:hypothetical protein
MVRGAQVGKDAGAAAGERRHVAAGVDEDQRRAGMADDRFLDMLQRLAAALQGDGRLGLEIGGGRHPEVFLTSARGDRKAVAGKIEERDIRALRFVSEFADRLFKAVEIEVSLHCDSKADFLEALRREPGVDGGIGEGCVAKAPLAMTRATRRPRAGVGATTT